MHVQYQHEAIHFRTFFKGLIICSELSLIYIRILFLKSFFLKYNVSEPLCCLVSITQKRDFQSFEWMTKNLYQILNQNFFLCPRVSSICRITILLAGRTIFKTVKINSKVKELFDRFSHYTISLEFGLTYILGHLENESKR